MTYEEAKKHKEMLEEQNRIHSKRLSEFPTGELGLVLESARKSHSYIEAKRNFDKSFSELRNFNKWFVKVFKKEYANERRGRH